jgi:hypothetical protein
MTYFYYFLWLNWAVSFKSSDVKADFNYLFHFIICQKGTRKPIPITNYINIDIVLAVIVLIFFLISNAC